MYCLFISIKSKYNLSQSTKTHKSSQNLFDEKVSIFACDSIFTPTDFVLPYVNQKSPKINKYFYVFHHPEVGS